MKISADLTLDSIISQFSKKFPGLKLEFYSEAHKEGQNNSNQSMLAHDMTLKNINPKFVDCDFILDPQMSVSDFEKNFKKSTGLNVQVFRKSNDLWLQTSSTDSWTLEVQNSKGLHSMQTH